MNNIISQLSLRILDIAYRHKLSHLGSCLTALPIICEIYAQKQPNEKFVLSAGHSGLALYVVLEHLKIIPDAEDQLLQDGIHPTRRDENGIDCSTGSLGQGITVAVGMALADPAKKVYVLCTDGEMAEGSLWESLFFADRFNLTNLKLYFNVNGWTALQQVDPEYLCYKLDNFKNCQMYFRMPVNFPSFSWLQGLEGHYHVMNETEHKEIKNFYETNI
jgi:transketolase